MKNFSKPFQSPRLWQFFYTNTEHEKIAVGIIRCKEPQRTKKYKRNLGRIGNPNVRNVGFESVDEQSYF